MREILYTVCIIFILPIFLVQASKECTAVTQRLPYFSKCTVSFNMCQDDGEKKTVELTQCTQTYCANLGKKDFLSNIIKAANDNCLFWLNRTLKQPQCVSQCCGSPSYTSFTSQTMAICIQSNNPINDEANRITTIVFAVLIAVSAALLIGFIVYVCYYKYKIRNQISRSNPQNEPNELPIAPVSANRFLQSEPIEKLQWRTVQRHLSISKKDKCSICLDWLIDCLTSCDHQFHVECIKTWIKKHNTCPMCKSLSPFPLRIHCQKCGSKQAICNGKRTLQSQDEDQNGVKKELKYKFLCEGCEESVATSQMKQN